jgi:hypothetical protein
MADNSGLVAVNALTLEERPLGRGDVIVRVAYNDPSGDDSQPLLVSSTGEAAPASAHQLLFLPRGSEVWVVFRAGADGITTVSRPEISLSRFDPARDLGDGVRDGWRRLSSVRYAAGTDPIEHYVQWYAAATLLDDHARPQGGQAALPVPNARYTGSAGSITSAIGSSRACDGTAVLRVQYCESAISSPRAGRTFAILEQRSGTRRSVFLPNCQETAVVFPSTLRAGSELSFRLMRSNGKGGFVAAGRTVTILATLSDTCPIDVLRAYDVVRATLSGAQSVFAAASDATRTVLDIHLQAGSTISLARRMARIAAASSHTAEGETAHDKPRARALLAQLQHSASTAEDASNVNTEHRHLDAAVGTDTAAAAAAVAFQAAMSTLGGMPAGAHVIVTVESTAQADAATATDQDAQSRRLLARALPLRVPPQRLLSSAADQDQSAAEPTVGDAGSAGASDVAADSAAFDVDEAAAAPAGEDELRLNVQVIPASLSSQVSSVVAAAVADGTLQASVVGTGAGVTAIGMEQTTSIASSVQGVGSAEVQSTAQAEKAAAEAAAEREKADAAASSFAVGMAVGGVALLAVAAVLVLVCRGGPRSTCGSHTKQKAGPSGRDRASSPTGFSSGALREQGAAGSLQRHGTMGILLSRLASALRSSQSGIQTNGGHQDAVAGASAAGPALSMVPSSVSSVPGVQSASVARAASYEYPREASSAGMDASSRGGVAETTAVSTGMTLTQQMGIEVPAGGSAQPRTRLGQSGATQIVRVGHQSPHAGPAGADYGENTPLSPAAASDGAV